MAKQITGMVSSDKVDKTIVVTTSVRKSHPVYKKQYNQTKKFMVHDETNQAKIGDLVVIRESRPISAQKKFVLDRIIERGGVKFAAIDSAAHIDEPVQNNDEQPAVKKKTTVNRKPPGTEL